MATIYISNTTDNIDSEYVHNQTGTVRIGFQTFTTEGTFTLSTISLKLFRSAPGDPGTLTVAIRDTDASHKPTGGNLAYGTYDGGSLGDATPGAWVDISLVTPYELLADTEYAIVCYNADGPDDDAYRIDFRGSSDSAYAGGGRSFSSDGGATWNAPSATHDWVFKLSGAATIAPPASSQYYTKRLVAVASDELWYGVDETPTQLAASMGQLDTTDFLSICEAYGKVFIANNTNLKVADFVNVKITTADVVPGGAGTAPPSFGTVLTAAGGAKMVVDYITALDGACTIYGKRTTVATFGVEVVTNVTEGVSFTTNAAEVVAPHWYDYTVYGGSTTYGVLPDQATLVCNWRGRIVLSGNSDCPFQWYMTRQRNPWDRNYIANDAGAPIEGGNAEAGECGDIIISTISYSRDYLIFGCANSLWVMAGDPAENGALYEFYSTGGMLSANSWCWDKDQNLYVLSSAGLLKIAPGFGAVENITEAAYPEFVKDLAYNGAIHRLSMGYDRQRHGIQIAKTTLASGANIGFWYDLHTGGIFPESYSTACGIFSMFYYEADNPTYQKLLFGCNDGYIRFTDDTAKSDAATGDTLGSPTTKIDSYMTLGPIGLNVADKEGSLNSMNIITAGGATGGSEADSSDVDFKVWTGLSADDVAEKLIANTSPQIGGTVIAPGRRRGSTIRRKVRGAYFGLRIGNDTAGETWGLEKVVLNTKKGGKIK